MTPDVEFLIACGALDDLLDDAECERLAGALEADPEGLAWSEELSAAYATLRAEPEPDAPGVLWERIAASVEAGELSAEDEVKSLSAKAQNPPLADSPPASVISISLACSFCHDTLPRVEAAYCAGCLAPHHDECFAEHGRCAAPGCGETHWVRAQAPAARPRKLSLRRRLQLVLGFGVLAGAAFGLANYSAPRHSEPNAGVVDVRPATLEDEDVFTEPGFAVPSAPEKLSAKVLRVQKSTVELSCGSDDGVTLGQFFVLSSGLFGEDPSWLVVVVSATSDRATAERVRSLNQYLPIAGDFAVLEEPDSELVRTSKDTQVAVMSYGTTSAHEVYAHEVYYLAGHPTPRFLHLTRYLQTTVGHLESFVESADPEWQAPTSEGLVPLQGVSAKIARGLVIIGANEEACAPSFLSGHVNSGGGLILLAEGNGQVREFGAEAALLSPVEDLLPGVAEVSSATLRPSNELEALQVVARDRLPPLLANRRTRLRHGARALLRDGEGNPLIAQWSVGTGQVLYVGTSELWRLKRLEGPNPGDASLYHALWDELLRRSLKEASPPPGRVSMPSLSKPLEVQGRLKQGSEVFLDLYRLGPTSLVKAIAMRGNVLLSPWPHVVIEEPKLLSLPPARYGWQATAIANGKRVVLGQGWVDHRGAASTSAKESPPRYLQLTPDELRARLLCRVGAALPDCDPHELRGIRDAAVALLAAGPELGDTAAAAVQALADGVQAPTARLLDDLMPERFGARRSADRIVLGEMVFGKSRLTGDAAKARLARWEVFEQAEFSYLQGDQDWLRALASYEIAQLTLGLAWTPEPPNPDVEPVRHRTPDTLEPPWLYMLGQLEKPVPVDPRAYPPRFVGDVMTLEVEIDPSECLRRDQRADAYLRRARTAHAQGLAEQERGLLQAALARPLSRPDRIAARIELARLDLQRLEQEPTRIAEVLDRLLSVLRLLDDRPAALELRKALAELDTLTDRQRTVQAELRGLAAGLERYRADMSRYPAGLRNLFKLVGPDGLVREQPDTDPDSPWRGPYAMVPRGDPEQPDTVTVKDPWGQPYAYEHVEDPDSGRSRYTLTCYGADLQPGGEGEARDLTWSSP